jgi:hypothetical protein
MPSDRFREEAEGVLRCSEQRMSVRPELPCPMWVSYLAQLSVGSCELSAGPGPVAQTSASQLGMFVWVKRGVGEAETAVGFWSWVVLLTIHVTEAEGGT